MRKTITFLIVMMLLVLPCFVFGASGEESLIDIYMRPEDEHPDGVNMEIGVASFWFMVGAKSNDPSGEISYQWYVSDTLDENKITPIPDAVTPVLVPAQEIGTKYYCVAVTVKTVEKTETEITKLLEATFVPKVIDKIDIVNVVEPEEGAKPSISADPYTDFDLYDYFGYDIVDVSWQPEDESFKADKDYTINITIEYWENVQISGDTIATINGEEAKLTSIGDNRAIVSYKFEKDEPIEDVPNIISSGDIDVKEEVKDDIKKDDQDVKDVENSVYGWIGIITLIVIVIIYVLYKKKI